MKIDNVSTVNLGLLSDAFTSGILNTDDISKSFGQNISLLLSHIKISFFVSEISILEAYILKRFCGGNFIDLETSLSDDNINKDEYPVTNRSMQSLSLLNKSIADDEDVTVKPGALLYPCKCVEKSCIVTFTGMDVLTIIGSLTRGADCFFIKVNTALNNPEETRSKDDIMNDILIETFYKEFYKFMIYKLSYVDLLTDSTLEFMYLDSIKNDSKLVALSHINTLHGMIPFINIDQDQYNMAMEIINENKKNNPINDEDVIKDTTEVFFVCNTSVYSFLELYLALPLGCILESTDIKAVYTSHKYIIPQEMGKYQTRVTSILERLNKERMSVYQDNKIDQYNLIPLNSYIQYSIKFKLSEVSNILYDLESKIKNNIYGDENSYLAREILKIISMIKNYSIAVYKSVF